MPSVKSSAITHVDYNSTNGEMYVTFKQGHTYTYYSVPKDIYAELISAKSVGTYFNDHVRDKYSI